MTTIRYEDDSIKVGDYVVGTNPNSRFYRQINRVSDVTDNAICVDDVWFDIDNFKKYDYEDTAKETKSHCEDNNDKFANEVTYVFSDIVDMLIDKNKKYGNSALSPIRVFSKADNIEQIKVRIDDKLSRIKNQSDNEDEDVIDDLIGYLVLLKIALRE